jgi:hypothetical protein
LDHDFEKVELSRDGKTVFSSNGFLPATVAALWRRPKGKTVGPDIILGGSTGGSSCCYDLMSFNFSNHDPLQLLEAQTEQVDIILDENGVPSFSLPFDMEAVGARTVIFDFPVKWGGSDFVPDLPRLVKPLPEREQLAEQEHTIRAEISAWKISSYPPEPGSNGGDAPETVEILLSLVMGGHAGTAKAMLSRAWPASVAGSNNFWRDFSAALKLDPFWLELGVGKLLPEATIIERDSSQ